MKGLGIFIMLFLGLVASVQAQPYQNPYDSFTPGSYNNYVRERNNAAINAQSLQRSMSNNTSSSSGSSYTSAAQREAQKAEYERIGAELMRAWKGPSKEEIKANEEYRKQLAAQAAAVAASNANAEAERRRFCAAQEASFINTQKANYTGSLNSKDQQEMYKDGFFATWSQLPWEAYSTADASVVQFDAEKSTGDFSRLLSLANLSATHPYAATECYNYLYGKFPDKLREIELAELYAMPFYFGARRRMLYPSVSRAYPEAVYEDAGTQEKAQLMARFKTLSEKYPKDALSAMGACRAHLNPYFMMAQAKQDNPNEAATLYLQYLRCDGSQNPVPKYDNKDHAAWEGWADRRIRPVAQWLVKNSPATVTNLSSTDWTEIARAQNLRVDLIAWAFRADDADPDDEDQPHYWKRFPALAKARKMDK